VGVASSPPPLSGRTTNHRSCCHWSGTTWAARCHDPACCGEPVRWWEAMVLWSWRHVLLRQQGQWQASGRKRAEAEFGE